MKSTLRKHVAAAALLLPMAGAFLAAPAHAQYNAVVAAEPGITSMALNSNAGLAPGATLRLQLYATPGARWANASLGDGIRVALREQSPGNYVGFYTVRRGDRIDPSATIVARAGFRDRVVTRDIDFPPSFQQLAMGGPAAAPQIERFVARSFGPVEPGRELVFRVRGTPNAYAFVRIPGVTPRLNLAEVQPGLYEGRYTVRGRDDVDAFDNAVAVLRDRGRQTVARVDLREGGGNFGWNRDRDDEDRYGYGYGNR